MTNSDYIALASAFIAICALTATCWQAWLSYQHNRLSTRPLVIWDVSRRSLGQNGCALRFTARNLGLGPAIVKERYFTNAKVRFQPTGHFSNEVREFLSSILGKKVQYTVRQFGLPGTGSALPSGGEHIIADVEFPTISFDKADVAAAHVGLAGFHMRYESIYGESFFLEAD